MKTFVPLILTLVSASVYSGGDYFPIHITQFSSDKDEFRFTARISKEREWMERECKDISVVGEYDTLKWALKKAPMNRENHMEAIEYLSRSYHNKENEPPRVSWRLFGLSSSRPLFIICE